MVLAEGTRAGVGGSSVVLLSASWSGPGMRHPGVRDRRDEPGARGFCAAFQKLRTNPAGVTESATHSTAHDDAAGHHHAGSPVRLQGGQRARVVSHDAIMTDCVGNGQIARMPPAFRDEVLHIAQSSVVRAAVAECADARRNMLPY